MDYKELLRKYMEHVGNEEGINFVPLTRQEAEQSGYSYQPGAFTEEELIELKKLEQ